MLARRGYDWRETAVVLIVGIGAVVVMSVTRHVVGTSEFDLLVGDPLAVARAGGDIDYVAVGWITHLVIIMWAVAAMSGAAGARLRWDDPERRREALMFGASGLLSLGLLVDDLFQVHESVFPIWFGVDEKRTMAAWAVLALMWFAVFSRLLVRNRHLPLVVLAGLFLAASIAVDVLEDAGPLGPLTDLVGGAGVAEDGPKLVGVFAWAVFHWRAAVSSLVDRGDRMTIAAP